MEGLVAGTIRRHRGSLSFQYDADYAGRTQPTPISTSMPVGDSVYGDRVVAPWIAGLLPDDERVVARWAREMGVSAKAFDLLGTRIGEDCAGAVQFARPERVSGVASRPGSVEELSESDIAARLRELRADSTTWRGRDGAGRFSLAGAQAKTALSLKSGRWGDPSGAAATTHILKPAISGLDNHDLNEHLCLASARLSGLSAVPTRIQSFEGESAIVVERYDRFFDPSSDVVLRIHQEDICQALSVDPSLKYEADGGPGVRSVIGCLAAAIGGSASSAAVYQFVDAVIWNWLIAGTDAHAKNYSLILSGDAVELAPMYDVASALPYPGFSEQKMRFAMRVGSRYYVAIRHNPWPRAAKMWGLDYARLHDRVIRLASMAGDSFSAASKAPELCDLDSVMPSTLTDLVAERAARAIDALNLPLEHHRQA